MDELVKLTKQSLVVKKKSKHTKPRHVVVKLDEGDGIGIKAKKLEMKVDSLSGVVRDVLLGYDAKSSDKPSTNKKRGQVKATVVHGVKSTENLGSMDNAEVRKLSRKSKHRQHGRERKHRNPGDNLEERGEKIKKDKKKRGHGQGKNED